MVGRSTQFKFELYTRQVPLQLQQPGLGLIRTPKNEDDRWSPLEPGHRRPLHWPEIVQTPSFRGSQAGRWRWPFSWRQKAAVGDDASDISSLSMNVRVSQPGWSWSNGIRLGDIEPGEMLVKVSMHSVTLSSILERNLLQILWLC